MRIGPQTERGRAYAEEQRPASKDEETEYMWRSLRAPVHAVVRRHPGSLPHSSAKSDRIPIGHISGLRYSHLMHPSSSISGCILSSLIGPSRIIKSMYDDEFYELLKLLHCRRTEVLHGYVVPHIA